MSKKQRQPSHDNGRQDPEPVNPEASATPQSGPSAQAVVDWIMISIRPGDHPAQWPISIRVLCHWKRSLRNVRQAGEPVGEGVLWASVD
jgi:hypothetical protein